MGGSGGSGESTRREMQGEEARSSRIEQRWLKREPRTKDGKIKRIDRSWREGRQPCGY